MKWLMKTMLATVLAVLLFAQNSEAQLWRFRPYHFPDQTSGYLGATYVDSHWYSPEYWRYHALFEPEPAKQFYSGASYFPPEVADRSLRSISSTANLSNDRVLLRVVVPEADSEVWINEHLSQQTGTERNFISPLVNRGERRLYTVRASWTENGQDMTSQKKVWAVPGRWYTVDLTQPSVPSRTLRTQPLGQ